jgi:hypothetical protein
LEHFQIAFGPSGFHKFLHAVAPAHKALGVADVIVGAVAVVVSVVVIEIEETLTYAPPYEVTV